MSTEYNRPSDGKGWKAVQSNDDPNAWCVVHPTRKIATAGTRGRAIGFNKDQAQSYALALNIVDAGVDLREAVEKLKLMHTITAQCGTYGVAHTYASWVEDFLRSIANAVEGTTKEEGV